MKQMELKHAVPAQATHEYSAPDHAASDHTVPENTEPVHAAPKHVEPVHAAPKHVEPVHAAPKHVEPVHAAPKHVEPVHAAPEHTAPEHAAPDHSAQEQEVGNFPAAGNLLEPWHIQRLTACGWLELAPEVEKKAEELIGRYYPYLQKAGLVFLFRLGKWHQAGELVKARTFVVPEVWKVFCGFDLAVLINKDLYEGTDEDGKQALVDYSLSSIAFCRKDGVYRWRLKKPDIVEHSAVLKRSGICMSRWRAFDEKEMEQMSFLDMSKTIDETYAAEMLCSGKPKEAPEVVNYCVELEEVTEEDLLPGPGEEVQVLYEAAPPAEGKSEGGDI